MRSRVRLARGNSAYRSCYQNVSGRSRSMGRKVETYKSKQKRFIGWLCQTASEEVLFANETRRKIDRNGGLPGLEYIPLLGDIKTRSIPVPRYIITDLRDAITSPLFVGTSSLPCESLEMNAVSWTSTTEVPSRLHCISTMLLEGAET
jgi:hypothetical protein